MTAFVNAHRWVNVTGSRREEVCVALRKELKELLVCPKCRGDLEFREAQAEIRCTSCRLSYPIKDDIPVLLLDQATPFESAPTRTPKPG
jgi:uncharacterized protein YbaR (Trm112 family)